MKYSLIVTGYNCQEYVEECILSCLKQNHNDYEVIAVDDGSTDQTLNLLKQFENITIIHNEVNMGACYSRWVATEQATGDVVCYVGMDDMLTANCLQVLDKHYADPYCKMTYGSWRYLGGKAVEATYYPKDIFKNKSFRRNRWRATALQTFRRDLVRQVPKDKLKDKDGRWLTNCTDLAIGFPCLELCEIHEVRVVKEIVYLYRADHSNTTLKRLGRKHKSEVREYLKRMECM